MKNGPALWTKILEQFPPGAIVAGGAVRDYLLGVEPKDIDVFMGLPEPSPEPLPWDPENPSAAFEAIQVFNARGPLYRIDDVFERKEEYEALNNIDLVSRGTMLGYQVDAIVFSDNPTPLEIVKGFDFGINQCWFDTEINDTAAAVLDRQTRVIRLYHFDRLERSQARFKRFNKRHGGTFSLWKPC